MPAPLDYEYVYNGQFFGGLAPIGVLEVDGLDLPPFREDYADKMQDHGGEFYAEFFGARRITFTGDALADDQYTVQELMQQMKKAFLPQRLVLPLSYKQPGEGFRRVYCKPAAFKYKIDRQYSLGYVAEWVAQLVAPDPRLYSEDLHVASGAPATDIEAVNGGIFNARPVVTLTGPADTPRILHVESGKYLQLNTILADGDQVVFDESARTIELIESSLYSTLDEASEWFKLDVGVNTLQLSASSTTGATSLQVEWRDAWV